MAKMLTFPRFMRPAPLEGDNVSSAFAVCCGAINQLDPKYREMVTRWLSERYAQELADRMQQVDDSAQPIRDAVYRTRINGE